MKEEEEKGKEEEEELEERHVREYGRNCKMVRGDIYNHISLYTCMK